jgi:hypothetical protein
LRWDLVDTAEYENFRELAEKAGRPICALLFNVEEREALQKCPGNWTKVAVLHNTTLWRLDSSRTVAAGK